MSDLIRDERHKHWGWFYYRLVDEFGPIIKADGVAVYMILVRHSDNNTGESYPSVATIARKLGISRRQVSYVLERLQEVGLVAVDARYETTSNGKRRQTSNIYRLLPLPETPMQILQGVGDANIAGDPLQIVQGPHANSAYKQDPRNDTHKERENTGALTGVAGTYDDSDLHRALSSMSDTATGAMSPTGPEQNISRNSLPCAEPVEVTVRLETQIPGPDGRGVMGAPDSFDSLPSARPSIVNGRPVRGAAPAAPPATKHPAFAPTVTAIKAGYPARDGAGPTDKEIRRALALVDPAHYPAIVAALPVYSRCKDVREGVICSIGKWLADERWTVYQPKAAPVPGQLPASVSVVEQRRAQIRARKEQ